MEIIFYNYFLSSVYFILKTHFVYRNFIPKTFFSYKTLIPKLPKIRYFKKYRVHEEKCWGT